MASEQTSDCYYCGAQTTLYIHGVPICINCDQLTQEQRDQLRAERIKTEGQLRTDTAL